MQLYNVTIGGRRIENVFHYQGSNYVSLRYMVYALEGITHEQNEVMTVEKQRVVWNAADSWAIFRIKDKFTGENKTIEFSTRGLQNDTAPTPREVKVNGEPAGKINFVYHKNLNMIGVRELSRLAGLESYLQWYNRDDGQYVDLRVEDPHYGHGGLKAAVDTIVKNQGGIPRYQNGEFYQVLYGTANKGGKVNRYSGYIFSVMDAVQWLIQTGGGVKFVLQIRDTASLLNKQNQIQAAVDGQWGIIQQFIRAGELLAKCGYEVKTPDFIVGTPEENVKASYYGTDGAIAIYEDIIKKLEMAGCSGSKAREMISGIYFGSETAKSDARLVKEIRDYIVGRGGKLLWIPYFVTQDDLKTIKETAVNFDKVILQPSTFYLKDMYYKGRNADGSYSGKIDESQKWKDIFNLIATDTKKYGIELEFDMGIVTGRSDRSTPMSPTDKRKALIEYIDEIIPRIGEFPIGIYSGGPNEHGFNNIFSNRNLHNNQNHVPTVTGFGTGSNYSDLHGGNLIYRINSALFANQTNKWKQAKIRDLVNSL